MLPSLFLYSPPNPLPTASPIRFSRQIQISYPLKQNTFLRVSRISSFCCRKWKSSFVLFNCLISKLRAKTVYIRNGERGYAIKLFNTQRKCSRVCSKLRGNRNNREWSRRSDRRGCNGTSGSAWEQRKRWVLCQFDKYFRKKKIFATSNGRTRGMNKVMTQFLSRQSLNFFTSITN